MQRGKRQRCLFGLAALTVALVARQDPALFAGLTESPPLVQAAHKMIKGRHIGRVGDAFWDRHGMHQRNVAPMTMGVFCKHLVPRNLSFLLSHCHRRSSAAAHRKATASHTKNGGAGSCESAQG
jgi:hypothetical protein